jgi:hypothetical protein
MNEGEVLDILEGKHPPPAWAFLPQIRNGTGYAANRTADALAMSLWPSRGLHLHGFEVKVSRGDWLRELKEPAKADDFAHYCHFWWVAVPAGEEIVKEGELPPTWGLLSCSHKRIKVTAAKTPLVPKPLDVPLVASILRNFHEAAVPKEKLRKEYDRGLGDGIKSGEMRIKHAENCLQEFEKIVQDFENASGLKIGRWTNGKDLGEAVRLVLSGEAANVRRQLEALRNQAIKIVKSIEETMEEKP